MSKQPIIISFDGNIGSGKSTIVNYFEKNFENLCKLKKVNYKICFLPEPVSIWESIKDEYDKNIIEKFYENNEKYGFSFQMMAYISRLSLFKEALKNDYDIIFTERSMFTDRNVFAKMLYDKKKIDVFEYQIYNKWFDEFAEIIKDLKTVYIRTDPIVCDSRVKKRARIGENISLDYLKDCHDYHDKWLNKSENLKSNHILVFDGNNDISKLENQQKISYYDQLINQVFQFIQK